MEQTIDISTIHMRHELICLEYENGEWKLKPGEAFQELRETRSDTPTSVTASSAQNVFAISIIGDTGNGKTFTTRELLSLDDKDLGAPFIGDAGTESPTSCNITCFKAENITSFPTSTYLLDYEGEKSSQNPLLKFKQDRKQRPEWNCSYYDEEIVQRRESVEKFFPQLAYSISNVVILVACDRFTSCSYLERCITIAERARSQHTIHWKPALICICNLARPGSTFEVDKVTETFKKQPGFQKLSNFFSDIICFRFPEKTTSKTSKGESVEDKNEFSQQITKLKKHLIRIHQEQYFRLLTLNAWLDLIEKLMSEIPRGEVINLSSLYYLTLTKNITAVDKSVLVLFHALYDREAQIHPRLWYHYCRRFAMKVLARSYTRTLPPSYTLSDEIRQDCKLRLKVLWSHLQSSTPCEEIYFGLGHPKNENHIVFCRKDKRHHESYHCTSEVLYDRNTSHFGLFQRVNLLASTRTNEGESRNYFANGQDGARDNRLAQDEIGRS
ncbi:unnamed protein product [Rotaria magnacalcarata]|uniref:Uncharacterized protein n=1 Tax=Rotaria magnacalcarata TaxID=392030 RepID=A0A816GMD0_9BILA|nr:unnamed protein product [Rotaria magnacalcarata]CAF4537606.1 unnamed protein product [Rotaria magnacalcarata]